MTERMTAAELVAMQGKAKRVDREGPVHVAILQFLQWALPRDAVVHHSPNEMQLTADPKSKAIAMAHAKRLGMRPGWPDLEIVYRGRAYFLEVKPADGGSVSEQQAEVHLDLLRAGAPVAVVRSVDEAQAALKRWGFP